MRKSQVSKVEKLSGTTIDTIIESIQEKKGEQIVCLDLRKINDAITDYFIICQADAAVQIKAITDNITERVKDTFQSSPYHVEGYENKEWVLIDYVNIVVHIFHKDKRNFYLLEELWSDAKIRKINSI